MKTLNNPNGTSLNIVGLDLNTNEILCYLYEFGTHNKIGSKKVKLYNADIVDEKEVNITPFNLINFGTQEQKTFDEIYRQAGSQLENFQSSEDLQNWQIEKGHTENKTTVRVYMPSAILGQELGSGSELDVLIQKMLPLNTFKKSTINGSLQYLEMLIDADRDFLTNEENREKGIIVEDKTI